MGPMRVEPGRRLERHRVDLTRNPIDQRSYAADLVLSHLDIVRAERRTLPQAAPPSDAGARKTGDCHLEKRLRMARGPPLLAMPRGKGPSSLPDRREGAHATNTG